MRVGSHIIMGIDPGLANTGWGIIRCNGARVSPVAYGCITTSKNHNLPMRLAIIHDNLLEIIDRYLPSELSVEGIYFGTNTKSAIPTAQARGAALVACAYKGLEYDEYTPMQIKQTLVGTGSADKKQIQYMVRAVLKTTSPSQTTRQTPWRQPSRTRACARQGPSRDKSNSSLKIAHGKEK